jgi:hypothetical protein
MFVRDLFRSISLSFLSFSADLRRVFASRELQHPSGVGSTENLSPRGLSGRFSIEKQTFSFEPPRLLRFSAK